jgi:GH15 family glucan-1,4-alpha-glucosidase
MNSEPYSLISDYGLIGDCYSCALISKEGSIDWACFPRFDSPSIFGRLLDKKKGGFFQIHPSKTSKSTRKYIPETNVLVTSFSNAKGSFDLVDFMPMMDIHGRRVFNKIIRIIECKSGHAELDLTFSPKFSYGLNTPKIEVLSDFKCKAFVGGESLFIESNIVLPVTDESIRASIHMESGERIHFLLSYECDSSTDNQNGIDISDCDEVMNKTVKYWQDWASKCDHQGAFRDQIIRSTLVLKLMIYDPSGAFVAAPTTSLPEKLKGIRNWDYRFTWLRDASLTVEALLATGHSDEAVRFLKWVCETARVCRDDLQIVYGLGGERNLEEKVLSHLEGYRGSKPVRVGNAAFSQFQLDTYGEILDCLDLCRRAGFDLLSKYWDEFHLLIEWVCANWTKPDNGIWEIRSEPKQFVHSKAMAWVALDRGIAAVEELNLSCPNLKMWIQVRNSIYQSIMQNGWNESGGSFVQHYDSLELDASNLRLSLVNFISATHPKMLSTVTKTMENLTKYDLVYRYVNTDDGLEGGEGTFAICTFWLIENLVLQGRADEARKYMDRILSCANDLGLMSEEIEPNSKLLLGNFPQAFSHIGLIRSALALDNLSAVRKGVRHAEAS